MGKHQILQSCSPSSRLNLIFETTIEICLLNLVAETMTEKAIFQARPANAQRNVLTI